MTWSLLKISTCWETGQSSKVLWMLFNKIFDLRHQYLAGTLKNKLSKIIFDKV